MVNFLLSPYFDKHLYEAEVDENEDIQHTVLTVTANDKDECKYQTHVGSTLNWSLYIYNMRWLQFTSMFLNVILTFSFSNSL